MDPKNGLPMLYKNLSRDIAKINASRSMLPMILPMICGSQPDMVPKMGELLNVSIERTDRVARLALTSLEMYKSTMGAALLDKEKLNCVFKEAANGEQAYGYSSAPRAAGPASFLLVAMTAMALSFRA